MQPTQPNVAAAFERCSHVVDPAVRELMRQALVAALAHLTMLGHESPEQEAVDFDLFALFLASTMQEPGFIDQLSRHSVREFDPDDSERQRMVSGYAQLVFAEVRTGTKDEDGNPVVHAVPRIRLWREALSRVAKMRDHCARSMVWLALAATTKLIAVALMKRELAGLDAEELEASARRHPRDAFLASVANARMSEDAIEVQNWFLAHDRPGSPATVDLLVLARLFEGAFASTRSLAHSASGRPASEWW